MANKVNPVPIVPRPGHQPEVTALLRYDVDMANATFSELYDHAQRLNQTITRDGGEAMQNPRPLVLYLVAQLPAAALWEGATVYVSNESGGAVPAFSDGTNWRRVTDRAVVS